MLNFFKYRGIRIRKFHCWIYQYYLFLMAFPFLLGIGYFFYLYIFPIVKPMMEQNSFDYQRLVFPSLVLVFVLSILFFGLMMIRRMSKVRGGFFLRVFHRQMLARMIMSRQLYDHKRRKTMENQVKEVIQFPPIYYKRKVNLVELTFPTDGKRYHEQFLRISPILEQMFVADVCEQRSELGKTTYELVMGVLTNRICIRDVTVTKDSITLMKGVTWRFSSSPHMLIGGGTGGGKTYFLFTLIIYLSQVGTVYVCDPKAADLLSAGELAPFKNHVFTGAKRIKRCLEDAEKEMLKRFAYMKTHPNYTWGKDYIFYEMCLYFVVVDEWGALMGEVGKDYKFRKEFMSPVTQIVLKGRQAGVFFILAMQRPDTEDLDGKLRDQFNVRVSLGKLEEIGYHMLFGKASEKKNFFNNNARGRGYYGDGDLPSEFYSPLVPSDFSFKEALSSVRMMEEDYSPLGITEEEQTQLMNELKQNETI